MPSTEPSAVPRTIGAHMRLKSALVGISPAIFVTITERVLSLSRLRTISPIPNTPMASWRHETDAVGEHWNVEGEATIAGRLVGADEAEQDAKEDHCDCLQHRAVRQRHCGDQAEQHQCEVFGTAKGNGQRRTAAGAATAMINVAIVPAKNEPSAATASATPALPRRAIW